MSASRNVSHRDICTSSFLCNLKTLHHPPALPHTVGPVPRSAARPNSPRRPPQLGAPAAASAAARSESGARPPREAPCRRGRVDRIVDPAGMNWWIVEVERVMVCTYTFQIHRWWLETISNLRWVWVVFVEEKASIVSCEDDKCTT